MSFIRVRQGLCNSSCGRRSSQMISNSWLRKWLASRDVWIAFDIGTNGYWVSPLVLLEYTHLDEYVPPTYDISPRLKTITTFCSLFSRKNTKWDLLNHTLMCLNASAFSEIITVWTLFSMQSSCYKGTPRKKTKKTKQKYSATHFFAGECRTESGRSWENVFE